MSKVLSTDPRQRSKADAFGLAARKRQWHRRSQGVEAEVLLEVLDEGVVVAGDRDRPYGN